MAKKNIQSVEPNIAELANGWLKSYKLNYKLEQESLNPEIDKALEDYFTKNGGSGRNRPDAKLLLQDKKLNYYPILIEYKGYKGRLVKLDACGHVENKTQKKRATIQKHKLVCSEWSRTLCQCVTSFHRIHRHHSYWCDWLP